MDHPLNSLSTSEIIDRTADETSINLVFSADQKFIPYFATTLYSVISNYTCKHPLHVYLLTDEQFTEAEEQKINRMRTKKDFTLHAIKVDAKRFSKIKTTEGISVAAYNRLYMPSVLPIEVTKALYLDSDIIVEKCISEIYDLDMEGIVARGAEDSISTFYKNKYDLDPNSHHINSGVMLCNLSLMRDINIEGMIEDFLQIHQYRIVMGDQQIINEVLYDYIEPLPIAWNVHGSMFNKKWVREKVGIDNSMTIEGVEQAVSSPAVIHYTYKRKPWTSLEHPRARTWHRYNEKTPYAVGLPELNANKKPNNKLTIKKPRTPTFTDYLRRANGYLRSILQLRDTRLAVNRIQRILAETQNSSPAPSALTSKNDPCSAFVQDALLQRIFADNGELRKNTKFVAADFVKSLGPDSSVLTNAQQKDLDGGFNENLKTIFRTSNISRQNAATSDFSLVLVYRPHLPEFWACINNSVFYKTPLIFAEMSFFAAFSTYFDKDSKPSERKCIGFILDDIAPYFDARQPSRLEVTLNQQNFAIDEEAKQRTRSIISQIISNRITKYNKYVPKLINHSEIEKDSIIVIDQKRGDASIEYARADNHTFDRMIQAALTENPGKAIYLKTHPDNLHRNMTTQSGFCDPRIKIIRDDISAPDLMDAAGKVYVVSSQMGFEALIRGKEVVVFGLPFYAGWGITDDRSSLVRRSQKRTIEEIFYVACIQLSVYIDTTKGTLIEIEDMISLIMAMRTRFLSDYADTGTGTGTGTYNRIADITPEIAY